MSKKLIVLFGIFIAALFIGIGCSDDDDCAACPDEIVYKGWVDGFIQLDPETYMPAMRIHRFAGLMPNIDSVQVGDSMVEQNNISYDLYFENRDHYWSVYFSEDGDPQTYMYESGDTATITIWGDGMTATCNIKLLDSEADGINSVHPAFGDDTLAVGESATCEWSGSGNADYYNILIDILDYVDGRITEYNRYYNTTDTFFTVTPEMLTDSVSRVYVNVIPVTGPDPFTGASNWTGNYITGRAFSIADYASTMIYGWNRHAKSLKAQVDTFGEHRPGMTNKEIIKALNAAFE